MSRLTDRLEEIEYGLARDPGDTSEALLSRRLVLRKALEAYGQEQRDEGRREGMRDALDTGYEARRLAAEKGGDAGFGVLNADGRLEDYSGHSLWHMAAYLPDGRDEEVAAFLRDHGIEVYRMWPVESAEQVKAAMDECEESLRAGKDGTDG
jgi:hypothetical protein